MQRRRAGGRLSPDSTLVRVQRERSPSRKNQASGARAVEDDLSGDAGILVLDDERDALLRGDGSRQDFSRGRAKGDVGVREARDERGGDGDVRGHVVSKFLSC